MSGDGEGGDIPFSRRPQVCSSGHGEALSLEMPRCGILKGESEGGTVGSDREI